MESIEEAERYAIEIAKVILEYAKGRKLTLKERFNVWLLKWQLARYERMKAKKK